MALYPKLYGLRALRFGRTLGLLATVATATTLVGTGLLLSDQLSELTFVVLSALAISAATMMFSQLIRTATELLFRAGYWHLGNYTKFVALPSCLVVGSLTWLSCVLVFRHSAQSVTYSLTGALIPLLAALGLAFAGSALMLIYTHIVVDSRSSTVAGWSARLKRLTTADCSRRELRRIQKFIEMEDGTDRRAYSYLRAGFPGLESKPFHNFAKLPWMVAIEDDFAVVKDELVALVDSRDAFERDFGWFRFKSSFGQVALRVDGEWQAEAIADCPRTAALLADSESPDILVTILLPGGRLPNHIDFASPSLVYQLGVEVPDACEIRVGSVHREWQEGSSFVFDNCFEHEVRNDSGSRRIVLLADMLHPELTAVEKRFFLHQSELPDSKKAMER